MRAAFLAISNNKRWLFWCLLPYWLNNTLKTFVIALLTGLVNIEMIRFRSAKEQQQITEKLAEGTIDIVIGTHTNYYNRAFNGKT